MQASAAATKSKTDDLFTPDKQFKFYAPGGEGVDKNVDKNVDKDVDTDGDTDNLYMDTGEDADENAQTKGLKRKAGPPSDEPPEDVDHEDPTGANDVVLTVLESHR